MQTLDEESPTMPTMSIFEKQRVYNNEWSNSSLSLVKKWIGECKIRNQKHIKKACSCKFKFNLVSVPSIVTGSLATALAFWAIGEKDGASYEVRVTLAFLSSVATMFKGVERLFNFKEEEHLNLNSAYSYEELIRNMEMIVFVGNKTRSPLDITFKEISMKFSSIVSQAPPV